MSESAFSYRISAERRSLDGNAPSIEAPEQNRLVHSYGGGSAEAETLRFRPAQKTSSKDAPRSRRTIQTKRRLKGFLVELLNNEARVGFVEDGSTVFYDLPADPIRRAGIEVRNQPFQMDEIETEDENGNPIVGYRFIALAKPSDAYIETLSFDEERKRKRALILKEFGETQD